MKPILILLFLGITLLFVTQDFGLRPLRAAAQSTQLTAAQQEAKRELDEAATSYREGNFARAQQHAEKALALDPLNKTAPLFIARTIHAQYKAGDLSETNVAKASEAIDAYKQILEQDPQNEEAYKAIAYFYNSLKDDDSFRQWVFGRAIDPAFSADKRAEAYVVLAGKDWDCSFKITELPTNKTESVTNGGSPKIRYTKPKDLEEFEEAHQCAANGLNMIDEAINLTPKNEAAWSYKTNLLLELSKLAEMDNDLLLKSDYERQTDAARSTANELTKKHASEPARQTLTPPLTPP